MPCGEFGWSDWWHRALHRHPTDRELARLESEHLAMARAARRHLRSRQLALSYDLKAYTVFNQRVALREREQRQQLALPSTQRDHNRVEAATKRIQQLQAMYIVVNPQLLAELNARHELVPGSPQVQAMPPAYPAYPSPSALSSPRMAALPISPRPPLPLPLPSAPPSPNSYASPTSPCDAQRGGESVTYMSSHSVSSYAIPSSSRPLSTTQGGGDEGEHGGDSPPPYYYQYAKPPSTAQLHVMLGQEV